MAETPPHVDYEPVARAAGLDAAQLRLIEQLLGVHRSDDIFTSQLAVYAACQQIQHNDLSIDAVRRLVAEQAEVERDVRAAFAGVTREGGVSWSEGAAMDLGGTDEEYAAARAKDTERSWEELVDDPQLNNNGPFAALDGIGFRYYLAPAMIRSTRRGSPGMLFQFMEHPVYEEEIRRLLTPAQLAAIGRYLRFVLNVSEMRKLDRSTLDELRTICDKWQRPR